MNLEINRNHYNAALINISRAYFRMTGGAFISFTKSYKFVEEELRKREALLDPKLPTYNEALKALTNKMMRDILRMR